MSSNLTDVGALVVRKIFALRGPNLWSRYPVLETWVDLGPLNDASSDEIEGFNDRLMSWLPSMIEHRCSVGERGGFFERLRRGTYMAHILEHVTIELQTLSGSPVGFGKARATSEEGLYKVVFRYREEEVARACFATARELILAAVFNRPFPLAAEIDRLRKLCDTVSLGPSTAHIADAAKERNIPARRLNNGSLMQLGYGSKQRRIWTAETDRTGAIAESISCDKQLTKSLLKSAGVPVPEGRLVESASEAWEEACELGLPVVVKPRDGNHGRAVFIDLSTRESIETAFHTALHHGSGVIVEKFARGYEHRLLVVGGKVAAVAKGEHLYVHGNGKHTILRLIEDQINTDPARAPEEWCPLNPVNTKDVDVTILADLAAQGFTPESIPPEGKAVLIQRNGNVSIDVTDRLHPEVEDRAVLAAQVVGLDIAGLDVVAEDIGRPLEEQGGVVVEVNAGPGLLMHIRPAKGQPQPVGKAIINTLFKEGNDGRIPIVGVTGTNGKTTTTRMIAHMLRLTGQVVGMTCSDGIYVGNRRTESGDCSGPRSARSLLTNPRVEAAVCEVARGGLLREGIGFDRCQVGVVTNLGEGDHLGQWYIDTVEQMAKVKQSVIDVVLPTGFSVLNADDAMVAAMAEASAGGVIFFTRNLNQPLVADHRTKTGRVVAAHDGQILLCTGDFQQPLIKLDEIPCTAGGRVGFQIENVLASVATAWALNLDTDVICAGLRSFVADAAHAPGRFNLLPYQEGTIVLDNAHNASALRALVENLEVAPHSRRVVAYSCDGDRRDQDIQAQARLLGAGFDRVILFEGYATAGRAEGEVWGLMRQELQQGPRCSEVIEITNPLSAVEFGLRHFQPGDLFVVQCADIEETVEFVKRLTGEDSLSEELVGSRA